MTVSNKKASARSKLSGARLPTPSGSRKGRPAGSRTSMTTSRSKWQTTVFSFDAMGAERGNA